jgi:hypothetical protein
MSRRIRAAQLRIWLAAVSVLALVATQPWTLLAQAPQPSKVRFSQISETDMRQFLGYLASDALLGRQMYTEGYGLAAAYVADHLRQWGVKPMGDDGTYFQNVKNRGYRVTRNSSVTVTVNGQSRTFKHGEHVTFPINSGGKQTLKFNGVEFVGYGVVSLPNATSNINYNDFAGRDVRGKAVMWMSGTPAVLTQGAGGRGGRGGGIGGNRSNYAIQTVGASAVFAYAPAPPAPTPADLALQQAQEALTQAQAAVAAAQAQVAGRGGRGQAGRGGARGGAAPTADITTVLNVEALTPPVITGDDEFYSFLFSGAPMKFEDIKARAAKGEPLTPATVPNAQIAINIDNTYEVVSTQFSKNVVGMVEGTDPKLKDTYVLFGSHLDHSGYRQTPPAAGRGGAGARGAGAAGGGAAPSGPPDIILNGADDDGSGSVALMGMAKAFAQGPKPKRSVIFVWHAGEEAGLLGSRYMADFPVVPLDKVQAQFNIDMIGRNRNDDPSMSNTVFMIGADRISTDLHNLVVDTNATLAKPLTLDYEYNDPSDPNSFYTRSDHYSYAAKGIPIAFFFTGTHPDYHQPGDHPDKILYPKLTAIAQLVYQAGFNVANSERTLTRDNKGPRAGRGFSGRIER